jgi:teichuronic acid biosynthesis glycosyltransferase TuaG
MLKNDFSISCLIVNYNYAKYLEECIESVLRQSYPVSEIIVVDNGSTDQSLNILRKFGRQVTIIANANNEGLCTALNRGIHACSGSHIAFLDSDDRWFPDKTAIQVSLLEETGAEFAYTDAEIIDEVGRVKSYRKSQLEGAALEWLLQNPSITPFTRSTILLRKSLLFKSGLWDTNFKYGAEDFDLIRRCAELTTLVGTNSPLTSIREHSKSGSSKNLKKIFPNYRDNLFCMVKWFVEPNNNLSFRYIVQAFLKLHFSYTKFLIKRFFSRNSGKD